MTSQEKHRDAALLARPSPAEVIVADDTEDFTFAGRLVNAQGEGAQVKLHLDIEGKWFDIDAELSVEDRSTFEVKRRFPDIGTIGYYYSWRASSDGEWQELGSRNDPGIITFPRHVPSRVGFEDLFEGKDDKLKTRLQRDEATINVFDVECELRPTLPLELTFDLGVPRLLDHWVSIERLMAYWMEPKAGRHRMNVDRNSFMLAYRRDDGLHCVLLPVSGATDDCHTYLKAERGLITLHARNEGKGPGTGRLVVAVGKDINTAIKAAFDRAKSFVSPSQLAEQQYPAWSNGFYWCSWNAFYDKVTEDDILKAMESLDRDGVYVDGIIIDDGWQDIDEHRRWRSFKPNDKFPHGLKWLVDQIKSKYPYVQHVGVWHALMGYWNGMQPGSWLAKHYDMTTGENDIWLADNEEMRKKLMTVDANDIGRMYDDFYKYLSEQGISTVKVDVQGAMDEFTYASAHHRRLWRPYQDALGAAVSKYFDSRVIYCMAHVPDIFFYALADTRFHNKPVAVRNSNDFFPDIKESHAFHIHWNAINNLYTAQLNVLPDWDMFETAHESGGLHAIGRAISGGPVLITDGVGKTDREVVDRLTSRHPTKKALTVLRFEEPAMPRDPYQVFGESRLTRVLNAQSGSNTLTIALFNLAKEHNVQDLIVLDDFGDATKRIGSSEPWIVWREATDGVYASTHEDRFKPLFDVELKPNGYERLVAAPLVDVGKAKVAALGLLDKDAGATAITAVHKGSVSVKYEVRHFGQLGFYLSGAGRAGFKLNGRPILADHVSITSAHAGQLVKVDVTTAWRSLPIDGDAPYTIELTFD